MKGSLIATTVALGFAKAARNTILPMRPKPLIPTRHSVIVEVEVGELGRVGGRESFLRENSSVWEGRGRKKKNVATWIKYWRGTSQFHTGTREPTRHVLFAHVPFAHIIRQGQERDAQRIYSGVWRGALLWREKRLSERRHLIRFGHSVVSRWVTMLRLVIALALTLGAGTKPTQAFVVAPQHRLKLSPCARGCSSVPGER